MKSAFGLPSSRRCPNDEALNIDLDAAAEAMFGPLGPPAYESYKINPPVIWPPDAPDSFSGHPLSGRPIV